MKEIILASMNKGKIEEYRAMLEPIGYHVQSLLDYEQVPEIAETGSTFAENAMIKAKAVSALFGIPCLADDSGLEVLALHNAPGVHSQRYSPEGIPKTNNELLIRNLKGKNDRRARFVCVIVYYSNATGYQTFEGSLNGEIVDTPTGRNGFGYDPHFYVPEYHKTLAELPMQLKNSISHRGRALRKLMAWLSENEK